MIYGDKQPPLMIAVEPKSIERELHKEGFFNHQLKIDVEGTDYRRPAARRAGRSGDGQASASRLPAHRARLDHHRAGAGPLQERRAAPGIKRGGVLNVVLHEITVRTKPATIPEYFEVDLTGLEIGHSIHLSTLTVPEGVRVVSRDKNATVASIAAPTVVREAAAAGGGRCSGSGGGSGGSRGCGGSGCGSGAPGAAPAAGCGSGGRCRCGTGGRRQGPGSGQEVSGGRELRPFDASAGRARQSRAALCGAPAQCWIHGGGRDRPPPCLLALARALQRRGGRRPSRRRAHAGPEAHDLHERIEQGRGRGGALPEDPARPRRRVPRRARPRARPGAHEEGRRRRRPQRPARHRRPCRQRLSPRAHRHRPSRPQGPGAALGAARLRAGRARSQGRLAAQGC